MAAHSKKLFEPWWSMRVITISRVPHYADFAAAVAEYSIRKTPRQSDAVEL